MPRYSYTLKISRSTGDKRADVTNFWKLQLEDKKRIHQFIHKGCFRAYYDTFTTDFLSLTTVIHNMPVYVTDKDMEDLIYITFSDEHLEDCIDDNDVCNDSLLGRLVNS